MTTAPKKNPCGSCPYRQDVPSGLWHPDEYARLIQYDRPTAEQPTRMFGCHQGDDSLCSGWAGTHDMDTNMSIRIGLLDGRLSSEDFRKTVDYESPVPLFASGMEAAVHGLKEIANPGERADAMRSNLVRKGVAHEQ